MKRKKHRCEIEICLSQDLDNQQKTIRILNYIYYKNISC